MRKHFTVFMVMFCLYTAGFLYAEISEDEKLEMRKTFYDIKNRAHKFQNADRYHPIRTVHASKQVYTLDSYPRKGAFKPEYTMNGHTYTLEHFLQRNYASALLVLKNDKIVYEKYLQNSNEKTRFIAFSVGKSITSTLVGMAVEDGFISSVDDPLTRYLPALIGSAYETVTMKDALQMLSGVAWGEAYDWNDESIPFVRLCRDAIVLHRYRFVEGANSLRRERPVGSKFNYNGMDTALLGWALENATKKRLASHMEERMWQPAGMECDAAWLLDGPPEIGREFSVGSFVATLRDYGRFGLLLLNNGKRNGKQILSKNWIRQATTPDRDPIQYGKLYKDDPLGYGYQWWLLPNGRFQALGVYGQMIYIAPDADVVIVKLSHWPEAWIDALEKECALFFDAVTQYLQ